MDLISVIVPVYNVELYLERCVESIRNQTYKNLEIILVDDGSPDHCPQMCDAYAAKDKRIRVVHKQNAGLGMARNSGLEIASGTYVTFIDSDDWIGIDHIENLYQAISLNQADAAWGAHITVGIDGTEVVRPVSLDTRLYQADEIKAEILLPLIGADQSFLQDVQVNASSCMNLYKMELIRSKEILFLSEREAVGEDVFFNIDYCYYAQRIIVTNEVGYYYYENVNSISRKYDAKRFARTLNYYLVSKERATRYGLLQNAKTRVERSFLMKIRVAIRHVVMSNLPAKEKIGEIKAILNHELVQGVLHSYPVKNQAKAMQVLTMLMKKKNAAGVYCLMRMREAARSQRLLRKVLQRVGIGK